MTSNPRKLFYSFPRLASALCVALTLVVVGACSHKPTPTLEQQAHADLVAYEAQIRKVVPDQARADQLVALTNEFEQLVRDTAANADGYRAKAAALNSNYEATRADFEALLSQQEAIGKNFRQKAGALRERMVALTTDSEWEQLGKTRLPALEAYLKELRS